MEIYKDIIKFENAYEVSNEGNVRNKRTGLLLKPKFNKNGYLYVNLIYGTKQSIKWFIHRLVAFHFCPNPDNKPQVMHKDGNITNNFAYNLKWITSEEKKVKDIMKEVHYEGVARRSNKFTEDSIKLLPILLSIGFTISQINKLTGVSKLNIDKIIKGKSWAQLKLQFGKIRKERKGKEFKIIMSKELYVRCVLFWGNTVLNNMISENELKVI